MSILEDIKSTVIRQLIVGAAFGVICGVSRFEARKRAAQRAADVARFAKTSATTTVESEADGAVEPPKSEAHEFTSDPDPMTFKLLSPTSTHLTMSVDSESTATVKVATTAGPKKVGRRNKRPTRLVLVDPSDLDEMPAREQMRSSRRIER